MCYDPGELNGAHFARQSQQWKLFFYGAELFNFHQSSSTPKLSPSESFSIQTFTIQSFLF